MAKLSIIFKKAEDELLNVTRRLTKSQEVLVYKLDVNFAWRPNDDRQYMQLYPCTKNRKWDHSSDGFLIIEAAKGQFKYYDPKKELTGKRWSYVGANVKTIEDLQVWEWIQAAYENAKSIT